MARVIFFIVALPFLAFGCREIWLAIGDLTEAAHSATWPSVTGQILSVKVRVDKTGGARGGGRSYIPLITYSYSVNAAKLTGNDIAPGRYWNRWTTHDAITKFAAGTSAPVYYSPEDPKIAVLVPGLSAASFSSLCTGLLFVTLFGGLCLLCMYPSAP